MSRVIWKIPLETSPQQVIDVPRGTRFLAVGNQSEKLCLWFECDQNFAIKERRRVCTYVTGGELSNANRQFLGTVLFDGGSFVLHVYEEPL